MVHYLVVVCGIHGEMKFKPKTKADEREGWICHGYDGEGCCNITIQQVRKIQRGGLMEKDNPLLPVWYGRWINQPDRLVVNARRNVAHDDPKD
jgi:hypothetical protein